MSTIGHESELISVSGLKAALQKFKTDKVNPKQDVIADLNTIRDGASKGATALQAEDIAGKADKSDTYTREQGLELEANINQALEQLTDEVNTRLDEQDAKINAVSSNQYEVVDNHLDVETPDPNIIYREPGEDSYTEWLYSNGEWKKLSTIGFPGIDEKPQIESSNLVTSGGIADMYGYDYTNPEYCQVLVDTDKKIVSGRRKDGTKVENVGIETNTVSFPNVNVSSIENPEFMELWLDKNKKIIRGTRKDGTKVDYLKTNSSDENKQSINNPYTILNDVLENSSNVKYINVSSLGKVFYIHLTNLSEKACILPIYFCDSSYNPITPATEYFLGASAVRNKNIKYGREYLKSGEDITFPIINPDLYPYISVNQNYIQPKTKICIEICTEEYGLHLNNNSCTIPYLNCGRMYIQPKSWNYAHVSRLAVIKKYLLVFFSGAHYDSMADDDRYTKGQYATLAILERGNYNNVVYKRMDGQPSKSSLYDYGNPNVRMCAKDDNLYVVFSGYNVEEGSPQKNYLRVFDTTKFEFSDSQQIYLKYNNSTVEWTKANEISMLNTLYGSNIPLSETASTETGDMRYYNGYFYTFISGLPSSNNDEIMSTYQPWVLMKSTDCVTWEPVANINTDSSARSAELSFDINDGIMLVHIRSLYDYNGYMVYNLNNNTVLKAPTKLNSIASKGSVFVKDGKLYIVYNLNNIYSNLYYGRTRILIAELNSEDYTLTNLKSYNNPNGFQYYDLICKDHVVYMSNTEDPRGYNAGIAGPYGGCTLTVINDDVFNN